MSFDFSQFDASQVEPDTAFELLPAGDYKVFISSAVDKPTKSGNGSYLELQLEVLDGEHKGRRLWDRLNLVNPNEMAVDIARRQLSAICRAIGVLQPKSEAELQGKPLLCKVAIEKDKEGNSQNRVKGYAPLDKPAKAAPSGFARAAVATFAATPSDDDCPF